MKLDIPEGMHFDRLKFTYLALSHFHINKHLAQLHKHKASLLYLDKGSTENRNIDNHYSIGFKNCS